MSKSILERIFPKPRGSSLLPFTEPTLSYDRDQQPGTPRPIQLSSNVSSRSSRHSSTYSSNAGLRSAPLSTSIIHHDDPFLAIDRAASSLQQTIQSLLDFQAQVLSGRHEPANASPSTTMSTTASSMASASQQMTSSGVMPIRQPTEGRPTLRSTRRSLLRSMQRFAALKKEELQITQNETQHRTEALRRAQDLEARQEAVQHAISTLRGRQSLGSASSLRQEASTVQQEITALEDRLMELKARHRHLVRRAEEVESISASELSGYEGTLRMVSRDINDFLKHPPVHQALGPRIDTERQEHANMYVLRAERRTLDMAKEQWSDELDMLRNHRTNTEKEQDALLHGQKIWIEVVERVEAFESQLAHHTKTMRSSSANIVNSDPSEDLLRDLGSTTQFLERKLALAEKKQYTLLIAAIGAELEAFKQAQQLLDPKGMYTVLHSEPDTEAELAKTESIGLSTTDGEDNDVPSQDLLGPTVNEHKHEEHDDTVLHHSVDSNESNESLKATLKGLQIESAGPVTEHSPRKQGVPQDTRHYESDDDDPGPDFLICR